MHIRSTKLFINLLPRGLKENILDEFYGYLNTDNIRIVISYDIPTQNVF
jgi:hypothetical protein